ncbi:hypothetical protein GCM10027047_00700 [Rhodococcus aerolatus]
MLSAVPEWLQIAQSAGAVLGGSGALVALLVLLRDRRRYRTERAERDAVQARGVIVEVGHQGEMRLSWQARVTNHSPGVILDVVVDPPPNSRRTEWRLISRDEGWFQFGDQWRTIPPGGVVTTEFTCIDPVEGLTDAADARDFFAHETTVHFTDAAGLYWRRTGSQQPVVEGPEFFADGSQDRPNPIRRGLQRFGLGRGSPGF